mgnify:CR=1 FL=1
MRRGREEFPAVVDHARQLHLVRIGAYASADTVYDGLGLLVYLLEHEMLISFFFRCVYVPCDMEHFSVYLLLIFVKDSNLICRH